MSKLDEILRSGVAPGYNTKAGDPTNPERAVPKAFKDLEQKMPADRIAKEAGFSVNRIKRIWNMVALLTALLVLPASAGDLTRSITFADGQRITAAQLHTLVDGASVNATFLTGKNLLSAVDSSDYVLLYDTSAGTFVKMTLSTLLMNNTGLITTQAEEVNPAYNDYVLLYDASGTSFAKTSITNLLWNTNTIGVLPAITTLGADSRIWVRDMGTNAAIQVTNLWANFKYRAAFTNLLTHTAPTNTDQLLIWDSIAGTNKTTTLSGLITNLPTVTTNGPNDWFVTVTNGNVSKITYDNLATIISNRLGTRTFVTYEYPISAGATVISTNHGFAGKPQLVRAVMVNTTTEDGYAVGDEVDAALFTNFDGHMAFTYGANATGVFLQTEAGGVYYTLSRTAGAVVPMVNGNWRLKIYATYYP